MGMVGGGRILAHFTESVSLVLLGSMLTFDMRIVGGRVGSVAARGAEVVHSSFREETYTHPRWKKALAEVSTEERRRAWVGLGPMREARAGSY